MRAQTGTPFLSSIPSTLLVATADLPSGGDPPMPTMRPRRSYGRSTTMARRLRSRCLTLLPTLNEADGLDVTLEEYAQVRFEADRGAPPVLVIDGHSTDGTMRVAQRWGTEWLVQSGVGKGAAIRDGLRWAREHQFENVAVMDADGTYPCTSLPALFTLLESGSDVAVGVRRPERTRTLRDLVHRCGNGLLNFAAAQLTRAPIMDVCSGFWGIRAEFAAQVPLESGGFDIEAELFVRAFRAGRPVAQLPIEYRERVGEAKLHAVRDGSRILWAIVRHALRRDGAASLPPPPAGATPVREPAAFRALLLSLAPQRLVLLSGPDRAREAEEVAAEFARGRPDSEVVTAVTTSPEQYVTDRPSTPLPLSLAPAPVAPVYVVLPPDSPYASSARGLLVAIPGTGRTYVVPERGGTPPEDLWSPSDRPARRRGRPHGLLAGLEDLYGFLDVTADHQAVRFFDANLLPTSGRPRPRTARRSRTSSGPRLPTLAWNPIPRTFQR